MNMAQPRTLTLREQAIMAARSHEAAAAKERHAELAGRPKANGGNMSTVSGPTGKARDKAGERVGVSAVTPVFPRTLTGRILQSSCIQNMLIERRKRRLMLAAKEQKPVMRIHIQGR